MLKYDKNTNSAKLSSAKVPNNYLLNLIIQKLNFFKLAQLFITSVSLDRGFFEGTREKHFSHIPGLSRILITL
jgi:hypothetical protein